jgi:hypothetical protein
MDDSRGATALSFAQLFVGLIDFTKPSFAPQQFARAAKCGVSPAELSASWQFSFRAALEPRAPSSAS